MLNQLAKDILEVNRANGFDVTTPEDVNNPLKSIKVVMLIKSEIAEALEALRQPGMGNFDEEIADVVIRALDFVAGLGGDLDAILRPDKREDPFHGITADEVAQYISDTEFGIGVKIDKNDPVTLLPILAAMDMTTTEMSISHLESIVNEAAGLIGLATMMSVIVGFDLEAVIRKKLEANKGRGRMHGGKLF